MVAQKLSIRTMQEIAEHEGLVLEAYKCSAGRWTWGFGVTGKSGHEVYPRYYRRSSSLERAVEVYEWLLRTRYLPAVERAFAGHELSEAQLTAALSFHWNTGAIERADWVGRFRDGDLSAARRAFMNWVTPREIIGRRKAERALFFDGMWTGDGFVTLYDRVSRLASANPVWSSARQIDIRPALHAALAKAG